MNQLPKNQQNAILKLFTKGAKLTTLKALQMTYSTRLAAIVGTLEDRGYRFKRKTIKHTTFYGTHGCHTEYQLDKKATPKKLLNVKFSF